MNLVLEYFVDYDIPILLFVSLMYTSNDPTSRHNMPHILCQPSMLDVVMCQQYLCHEIFANFYCSW